MKSLLFVAGLQVALAADLKSSATPKATCNAAMAKLEDASLICGSAAQACDPVCQPLLCGALEACSPKDASFGDLSIETTALQMKKMGRLLNNCACRAQVPEQSMHFVDQVDIVEVVAVPEVAATSSEAVHINQSSGSAASTPPAGVAPSAALERNVPQEVEAVEKEEEKAEKEEGSATTEYGDIVDEVLSGTPKAAIGSSIVSLVLTLLTFAAFAAPRQV